MEISQLIEACKKNNRNAQKELYEQFAPKMMGVCLRYSGDKEVARDLLHDGFIIAYTQISSFKSKGSFEGWLRRIFVNLALQNYRNEKKYNLLFVDVEGTQYDVSGKSEESIEELTGISQKDLLKMISELPEGYRTIFNLYVFEDMAHKEISQLLGISEASSRSQYSRARALLKKKIKELL